MPTWFKTHYKQLAVALLSVTAAVFIHLHPEKRDLVLMLAAALGAVGLHLPAITYGAPVASAASVAPADADAAPPTPRNDKPENLS